MKKFKIVWWGLLLVIVPVVFSSALFYRGYQKFDCCRIRFCVGEQIERCGDYCMDINDANIPSASTTSCFFDHLDDMFIIPGIFIVIYYLLLIILAKVFAKIGPRVRFTF